MTLVIRGRRRDARRRPAGRRTAARRSSGRPMPPRTPAARAKIQSRAAPMPRTGIVWLDRVCRVPNWTSRVTHAWMRSPSSSSSSERRSRSVSGGVTGRPGPESGRPSPGSAGRSAARAGPAISGAATATVLADRNARRVGVPRPFPLIHDVPLIDDSRDRDECPTTRAGRRYEPGRRLVPASRRTAVGNCPKMDRYRQQRREGARCNRPPTRSSSRSTIRTARSTG